MATGGAAEERVRGLGRLERGEIGVAAFDEAFVVLGVRDERRRSPGVHERDEAFVEVPEAVLSVALGNLIGNACKYTNEGEVRIIVEADQVRIEDTGPGLSEEDALRLFERGYRGSGAGGTVEQGHIQREAGVALVQVEADGLEAVDARIDRVLTIRDGGDGSPPMPYYAEADAANAVVAQSAEQRVVADLAEQRVVPAAAGHHAVVRGQHHFRRAVTDAGAVPGFQFPVPAGNP